MENLLNSLSSKGATLETDQSLRLPSRPVKQASTHLIGLAYEDLGTSLDSIPATQASKTRRKPTRRSQSILDDIVDSESEDEIDMLSQHDSDTDTRRTAKRTRGGDAGYVDPSGKVHEYHPSFTPTKTRTLAKLKFKKTNTATSLGSEPSSSQLKLSQDSATARGRGGGLSPQASRARDKRAENVPMSPKKPLSRQRKPIPMVPEPTRSLSRPKPRPIPPRSATSSIAKPGPAPFPSIGSPMDSSAAPRKPVQKTYGKANALSPKKSNSKITIKKPQPPTIKKPTINRAASSPSSSCTSRPTSPCSPVQSAKKIRPTPFPASSPLSSPGLHAQEFPSLSPVGSPTPTRVASHSRKTGVGKGKVKTGTTSKPRPRTRRIVQSDASDDAGPKPQPFPMGTPLRQTTGSPGPSRPRKRSSSAKNGAASTGRGTDAVLAAARTAEIEFEQDDDTLFISPSTDPRTLCPYCDSPLPASPSPLLTKLLAATAKRSYRDPRPANPLGRRAPMSVFIDVCQRHRFEGQILPQAEAQGWPKSLDWAALGHRVEKMQKALRELIEDVEPASGFLEGGTNSGPRSQCQFWNEIIREMKAKGSRAVIGVRGQFLNFEKTQPGYYGELGSVIIHQTLYNLFPPASLDAKLIAPLTAPEFIQRVLVPEVGARLIMEDMKLRGASGMADAIRILRESAAYGVAMFPEDGDRPGGRRGHDTEDDDGMDVADRIMMERAKKRRKELEEEEAKEMEQEEIEDGWEDEDGSNAKSKKKSKSKAAPSDTDIDVSGPEPRMNKSSRPKANKADLMSEADTSDAPRRSQRNKDKTNRDARVDTKPPARNPRARTSQTSTASSSSDVELGTGSFSNKRKVRPGSSIPDVNLCSDGENVITVGRPRKKKQISTSCDPDATISIPTIVVELTIPVRRAGGDTKKTRADPIDREAAEDTPRAASKIPIQTSDSSLFPLRRAREQVAASKKPVASGSGGQSGGWITSMRADPVDDTLDGDSIGWTRTSSESGSSSSRAPSYSWLLSDTPTPSR